MAPPDTIILSKPDIYDATGAIRQYASASGFVAARTLEAFTIYERAPQPD
jgi:hypothetical protein